jgi:Nuclear transport factor 2 (NTF2) domain
MHDVQVGNQFVTQYYTVLHKQPHFLHRFYTDDSTMTYSEPGSTEALVFNSQKVGSSSVAHAQACRSHVLHAPSQPPHLLPASAVHSQWSGADHSPAGAAPLQKIHEKVMSLGYQDAVTEIYSVDSQYSLNDGVIVQVTGSLRCTVSRFLL